MRSVEVGGLRMAYELAGEGPPLVLLHGVLADSRMWRRQLDALSAEFTVVAWDAPGCGQSSDPPERFGLPDYADCLAAFIDALGLERPHVLGLSWGGGLALELYGRKPALPRTLVLAAAYAGWAGSLPGDVVAARDVIFVGQPFLALAARKATREIPIICGSCGDPTDNGLAASLARPGGNVTGLASLSAELIGKRLELMKDCFRVSHAWRSSCSQPIRGLEPP